MSRLMTWEPEQGVIERRNKKGWETFKKVQCPYQVGQCKSKKHLKLTLTD